MATSLESCPRPLHTMVTNGAARKVWHTSAPQQVRQAFRAGDHSIGWSQWTEHLRTRGEPSPLTTLVCGKTWPLAWALPEEAACPEMSELLATLQRIAARPGQKGEAEALLEAWLSKTSAAGSAGFAIQALAWCHAMPRLAGRVSPALWWCLLEQLLVTGSEASRIELQEAPLVHQLLAGELGLTLAYLFPELAPCRKEAANARKELSRGLVELLDGEGLLHGRYMDHFRPLLACWTRCRAMGQSARQGPWKNDAETQYQWLVRAALRMTRQDGTQVLSRGSADAWCKDLFDTALDLAGDQTDHQIASLVLPGARKRKPRRKSTPPLPAAANHSEWTAVTVLRTGWARNEPRLTVVYPGKELSIECEAGSKVLWTGKWHTELRANGRLEQPESDWEEICWESDEDADYLELEMSYSGGVRLQRHLLLARQERFLLMADSLLGKQTARLEYRSALPISGDVTFQPSDETHEGYLAAGSRKALVLPLALPEWRCDSRPGRLAATEQGLVLQQSATGRNLFAPLWFDLDTRRSARPFTWRQLTVAESLETLGSDVAVGYRVMVGKSQWLIYRSLVKAANRTVLGHNLSTQMMVGTFNDGEVEPVLAIE